MVKNFLPLAIDIKLPTGSIGDMKTRIEPLLVWLREADESEASARFKAEGTTIGYVRQVAYGNKTPSGEKCAAIERVTGVSRRDMRPHDWHLIWPELAHSA